MYIKCILLSSYNLKYTCLGDMHEWYRPAYVTLINNALGLAFTLCIYWFIACILNPNVRSIHSVIRSVSWSVRIVVYGALSSNSLAQLALFTNYVIFEFETFYLKKNLLKFGHIISHSTNRLNVITVRAEQHKRGCLHHQSMDSLTLNLSFGLYFYFYFPTLTMNFSR